MPTLPFLLFITTAATAPPSLSPAQQRMLDPLRERSLRADALIDSLGLRGDERIADVGSGPGFFTLKLASHVPRGSVVATDVDGDALAVTARRATEGGFTNVTTRKVEPEVPGLEAASVDVAFLCQVDHYLADRVAYFRALGQALRPGGRLIVVNADRYRDLNRTAAIQAGYRIAQEGSPAPGHFLLICEKN